MEIDYKHLLRKYMQHVLDCEGTTFIGVDPGGSNVTFTVEELVELHKIDDILE